MNGEGLRSGAAPNAPPRIMTKKALTITQEEFLVPAESFLWADMRDYAYWFTGKWQRWKKAEYNLPRMVKKGVLVEGKYHKRKVYRLRGKRGVHNGNIHHGLVCTKALLLFKGSGDGEIISESFMRTLQLGVIPEWGSRYDVATLFFEFSTADNFRRRTLMTDKLRKYRRALPTLGQYFDTKPVVLFVYETSRAQVEAFVKSKTRPDDWAFHFIDLDTFWKIPQGTFLTTPVYMWAGGKGVSLSHA